VSSQRSEARRAQFPFRTVSGTVSGVCLCHSTRLLMRTFGNVASSCLLFNPSVPITSPAHTATIARFSLAAGLRKANVLWLTWGQVDLRRRVAWIHPDQAKAGRAITVPLNAEAAGILRDERGKHPVRVFTFNCRPVKKVNTKVWRAALKRAGIVNFRWHDLRHTWASWHVQNGTPLHALQELGGWTTFSMVLRYAHLSAGHLAEYSENSGTKTAHVAKRADGNQR